MKPTILVQHRMVYGLPKIYPVNELAGIAAELLGKKTLSDRDLVVLGRMGFEVSWLPQGEQSPSAQREGVENNRVSQNETVTKNGKSRNENHSQFEKKEKL